MVMDIKKHDRLYCKVSVENCHTLGKWYHVMQVDDGVVITTDTTEHDIHWALSFVKAKFLTSSEYYKLHPWKYKDWKPTHEKDEFNLWDVL